MKKTILILLAIVMVFGTACMLIACKDEKEPVIESYKAIEKDNYAIGDTYKETDAEIVAVLTDGSTRKITKNLVYVGKDALNLDKDGKFTTVGEYKIKVYAMEEREDLFIGEWTIKVA